VHASLSESIALSSLLGVLKNNLATSPVDRLRIIIEVLYQDFIKIDNRVLDPFHSGGRLRTGNVVVSSGDECSVAQ